MALSKIVDRRYFVQNGRIAEKAMLVARYQILSFVLLAAGCSPPLRTGQYRFWEPTPQEVERAVAVGLQYARSNLHVEETLLARMKSDAYGSFDRDRRRINLQFHDPQVFPDWNGIAVRGGFPAYFRIYVDAESMQVVGDYASAE